MGKTKPALPIMNPEEWEDKHLLTVALSALRFNLPATVAVCLALRLEIPEWVIFRLGQQRLKSTFAGKRPRQQRLGVDVILFLKQALRYESVLLYSKRERGEPKRDKFERTFDETEGASFMTNDCLGLRKSYYEFQRTLGGSPQLASFVADKVTTALISDPEAEPSQGIVQNLSGCEAPQVNRYKACSPKGRR